MDFVVEEQEEEEEEEEIGGTVSKGNLIMNPPNSSSSSSTSLKSQMGSWLANKYEPEEDLMEHSPPPPQHHQQQQRQHQQQQQQILKEHMFDKVVTPSDVGKLNRLVIPKQHAEKYFPLDSTTNEKGLLLNFEDRNGKPWRFRYSYWNSSQSYVMTKGWSRFVKDKKLDAGDIVSFHRGVGELGKDNLYIDWRRRPDLQDQTHHPHHHHQITHLRSIPWSPLLMRPPPHPHPHPLLPPPPPQDHHHHLYGNRYYHSSGVRGGGGGYNYGYSPGGVYMRSGVEGGMQQWGQYDHHQQQHMHHAVVEPMVYESVPVVQGKVAAKRLRLFGVNMDCPISGTNNSNADDDDDDDDDECDILSSTSISAAAAAAAPTMSIFSQPPPPAHPPTHHHQQLLRLYNGTPLRAMMTSSSTGGNTIEFVNNNKGSASSSGSLNLDI